MWGRLLSNEAIIAMVGHEAFARGMVYARNGKVVDVEIDRESMVVTGRVIGGFRDGYDTSVRLVSTEQGWTGHQGRCSCPVALDCKHTAALLIVARSSLAQTEELVRPAWEVAVSRLLGSVAARDDRAELGVELGVERTPAFRGQGLRTGLRMRPVRRGASGNWVRSQISWEDLDYASARYPDDQRDVLVQLRSAVGSSARFALPRSPWLDLGSVSAGFWALLEQARRVGVQVITEGRASDPLVATGVAEVVLDATRTPAGVSLAPVGLLHDQPLEPHTWGLIGDPAHGLYRHDPELTLARLGAPLPRELRRLVDESTPIEVPAGDEDRFAADFLPSLRRSVPVVSLDDSVAVPPPPQPQLELALAYRPEQRVRLDWAITYTAGERVQRFALDESSVAPIRDVAAEQLILAGLPLPYEQIPVLQSRSGGPAAHALLAGIDAAIFVAEVVPKLRAAGITVAETGRPVEYRLVETAPEVALVPARIPHADWFDLHLRIHVDGEAVPFEDVFAGLSRGEDYLVLDNGVYLPLQRPELQQLQTLIAEARLLPEADRPTLRLHREQVDLWAELLGSGITIDQDLAWQQSVATLVTGSGPASAEPLEPPEGLEAELRPYQLEGFRWAARLYEHGLGGILADDMGLGKTLQVLALICRSRERAPEAPPFLVVAPTSVTSTWAGEAARFAPELRVVMIGGSQAKTGVALAEQVAEADLVITSYALLRIDAEAYAACDWSGLIVDEAQFVKNHRSRIYQAVRCVPAPSTFAITGTPLENSLLDLWALFSLTAPGLLGPPERFAEFYRRPIERDHDAERLALLRRRIRPLLVRRTKELVAAELPARQEQILDVALQPKHQRVYQTYLQRERQKVLGLLTDLDGNRFTILRSLTLLRQLALDPGLVDPSHANVPASKLDVLLDLLAEITEEGHQSLVFSQFTSVLHRVADRLAAAGIDYTVLEGRTRDRDRVIEEFRTGRARVFLISLKAGGFGLNLTEADYCFLLDPWWNPAAEAQAVDRAHRIGQRHPVNVYRLVAGGTIEQKVMELKARKEKLAADVLDGDSGAAGAMSSWDVDDIRELLG